MPRRDTCVNIPAAESYHDSLKAAIARFLPCRLFDPPVCGQRWSQRYLAIAMILLSWSPATSLADRFKQARGWLAAMFPGRVRPGKTYQGLIEAVLHRGPSLLHKLKQHLRQQVQSVAGQEHWTFKGLVPLAVDGSKVECPKTFNNELAFGCAGKKRSVPQQYLTTLIHLSSGLVWDFLAGSGLSSERRHLLDMLPDLPAEALIVADAGFVGFEFLGSILASGRHFLIRAGRHVRLLRKLGFAVYEQGSTIYLWPLENQKKHPPLVLRLIVLSDGRNRRMHLLSSVIDPAHLSDADMARLYRLRWGVELHYRGLKQTLRRRKLAGASPLVAQAELNWAMIALWLLTLMGTHAIQRRGGPCRSLSIAAALRMVLQAAVQPTRRSGSAGLERQLAQAHLDGYQRSGSKRSRDWAHRKKSKPPGIPRARNATAAEVQLAQRFKQRCAAA
jgi:hypothetical protein